MFAVCANKCEESVESRETRKLNDVWLFNEGNKETAEFKAAREQDNTILINS